MIGRAQDRSRRGVIGRRGERGSLLIEFRVLRWLPPKPLRPSERSRCAAIDLLVMPRVLPHLMRELTRMPALEPRKIGRGGAPAPASK